MTTEPENACGKRRYATEREAIRNAMAASRKTGTPLRVYRCGHCQGWHLTKRRAWRSWAAGEESSKGKHVELNALGHRHGCPCSKCLSLAHPPPKS